MDIVLTMLRKQVTSQEERFRLCSARYTRSFVLLTDVADISRIVQIGGVMAQEICFLSAANMTMLLRSGQENKYKVSAEMSSL